MIFKITFSYSKNYLSYNSPRTTPSVVIDYLTIIIKKCFREKILLTLGIDDNTITITLDSDAVNSYVNLEELQCDIEPSKSIYSKTYKLFENDNITCYKNVIDYIEQNMIFTIRDLGSNALGYNVSHNQNDWVVLDTSSTKPPDITISLTKIEIIN
jgi:hypothetical protein